jgi:inosine/xanthosine triphosphatase
MKTVIVASENPVKVAVAKKAFTALYPKEEFNFIATKSHSGVGDQPMNDETEQGAKNRLEDIKTKYPEADYWISQEGGLFDDGATLYNRAWIMVSDNSGFIGKSSTPAFYLPTEIVKLVRSGMELGTASDVFFSTVNSKQGVGAIGFLTDGIVDRENYYLQAAIIALSELKHRDWYQAII